MCFPSGLKFALIHGTRMPGQDERLPLPVRTPHPHRLVIGGRDDVLPIRAVARAHTRDPYARTRTRGSPCPSARHTRTVLSEEAVTMCFPSGLKFALIH